MSKATVADLVRANFVRRELQKATDDGEALTFRPMTNYSMDQTAIVAVHDASFSNEAGMKSQQGYMLFLAQKSSFASGGEMHFLDWSSSTIKRVVRSTLAAESAAASKCFDRAVYLRVIVAEAIKGPDVRSWRWQDLCREVPMLFVSDCRSMVEHVRKTGAATDEKRVAMDLADLRAGVDAGDLVVWIPTRKMVADCLTKHLTLDEETESIRNLLRSGCMHLRYTDEGEERTLTEAQRKAEGLEAVGRESEARPVPKEMDSEDEASLGMHLPPVGLVGFVGDSPPGALALSKHTGVGHRTDLIGRGPIADGQAVRSRADHADHARAMGTHARGRRASHAERHKCFMGAAYTGRRSRARARGGRP